MRGRKTLAFVSYRGHPFDVCCVVRRRADIGFLDPRAGNCVCARETEERGGTKTPWKLGVVVPAKKERG